MTEPDSTIGHWIVSYSALQSEHWCIS